MVWKAFFHFGPNKKFVSRLNFINEKKSGSIIYYSIHIHTPRCFIYWVAFKFLDLKTGFIPWFFWTLRIIGAWQGLRRVELMLSVCSSPILQLDDSDLVTSRKPSWSREIYNKFASQADLFWCFFFCFFFFLCLKPHSFLHTWKQQVREGFTNQWDVIETFFSLRSYTLRHFAFPSNLE